MCKKVGKSDTILPVIFMKKKFSISGMSCVACSSRIERVIAKISGVNSVNVNLMANYMIVDYDENLLSSEKIITAVKNIGFGAKEYEYINENVVLSKKLRNRVIISFIFLILLMFLSMQHMAKYPLPDIFLDARVMGISQLILTIPIIFINRVYFIKGLKNLFSRDPNMDSLVAIGSMSAFIYGVYVVIRIFIFNERLIHNLYFESAGMILTLVTLGKFFESKAKSNTSKAIEKLIELTPENAVVLVDGLEKVIPTSEVKIGDIVLVRPGEKVPTDGTIIDGNAIINQSMITGESIPVSKEVNSQVIGGTINKNGFIKVKADKVGEDTMLSQIIRLVEEAGSTKAPIGRLADKISRYFVPTVISIAFISSIIWLFIGKSFEFALNIGISVLVISCPCALGLATPVAIMVGSGVGAKKGILIKSAEKLELAHKINTVIMDKTGTITSGEISVKDIISDDKDYLLKVAYSLEKNSEHPLGQAVVKYAKDKNINGVSVENFNNILGRGISGNIANEKFYGGNRRFLEDNGIKIVNFNEQEEKLLNEGKTLLYFASSNKFLGIIAVADTIRSDSIAIIKELQSRGIKTVMATGDNIKVAEFVKNEVGIDSIYAEILPQDKERLVKEFQENGEKVLMVGDGINDAPALTRADLGVAIGNGTDIAIESADVILMNSSLEGIVKLLDLSRSVINNVKLNLFWAFFYNSLGIPIAAGIFYNLCGITLSPMVAALAMSLSSVCVVSNALRLYKA